MLFYIWKWKRIFPKIERGCNPTNCKLCGSEVLETKNIGTSTQHRFSGCLWSDMPSCLMELPSLQMLAGTGQVARGSLQTTCQQISCRNVGKRNWKWWEGEERTQEAGNNTTQALSRMSEGNQEPFLTENLRYLVFCSFLPLLARGKEEWSIKAQWAKPVIQMGRVISLPISKWMLF